LFSLSPLVCSTILFFSPSLTKGLACMFCNTTPCYSYLPVLSHKGFVTDALVADVFCTTFYHLCTGVIDFGLEKRVSGFWVVCVVKCLSTIKYLFPCLWTLIQLIMRVCICVCLCIFVCFWVTLFVCKVHFTESWPCVPLFQQTAVHSASL
jgi:hypothetical protein